MILCKEEIWEKIDWIFTNYSIAYVGTHFSEAFKVWNSSFWGDVSYAIDHSLKVYNGVTCKLGVYNFNTNAGNISFIVVCDFNEMMLRDVEKSSNNERIQRGLPSVPPTTLWASSSPTYPNPYTSVYNPTINAKTLRYRTLKQAFWNGLHIGLDTKTHKYNILDVKGNPLSDKLMNCRPKIYRKPYGKKRIIAHCNIGGWLYAMDVNGKLYDMRRTWNNAYITEVVTRMVMEQLRRIYGRLVTEDHSHRIITIKESDLHRLIVSSIQRTISEQLSA